MRNQSFRFTGLSLLTAPLLAVVSIPFWRFEIARENPHDSSGFGIFGINQGAYEQIRDDGAASAAKQGVVSEVHRPEQAEVDGVVDVDAAAG